MAISVAHESGSEWRRHGWIILPCLAGNLLSAVHSYALGPMVGPLEGEFGWSRAEITSGLLVISIIAIIAAPIVGMTMDRFGARRIAVPGVLLYCCALALLGLATRSVVLWWLLWGLLGLANMCVAPMVWAAAVNRRFDKHRGMALALAMCGYSLAAVFVPYLTTVLIAGLGWRGSYLALAMISCMFVLPVVMALFHDLPGPPHRQPDNPASRAGRAAEVREQMRSRPFLKLAGAVVIFTIALCALTTNGVPVLIGEGFERTGAAAIAGFIGLGSIIGRLAGGFLLDRFDAKKVAAASVAVPVLAVLLLLQTQASQSAASVAFFLVGLAGGTEMDACAYLAARHFGMRNFGALFGMISGLILLANGIAPAGANYIYDITGSYDLALWIVGALFSISALIFLSLGQYPQPEVAMPHHIEGE